MLKYRILIAVIAILACVVLYFLPRFVMENDEDQELVQRGGREEVLRSPPDEAGVMEEKTRIPAEVAEAAGVLSNMLQESEVNSKKYINFVDSLARLYFRSGIYDSSARYFEMLLEYRNAAADYANVGLSYYELFNIAANEETSSYYAEKAKNSYDEAIKLDSSVISWQIKRAMLDVSGSNPMDGIFRLRDIAEENPDNGEVQYQLGVLSMQTGQTENAVERFTKVVNLEPNNFQGRLFLGVSLKQLNKVQEAVEHFQYVIENSDEKELVAIAKSHLSYK